MSSRLHFLNLVWFLVALLPLGTAACGPATSEVSPPPVSGAPPLAPAFSAATVRQLQGALNRVRANFDVPGVIVSLNIPDRGTWETAVGVQDNLSQSPMVVGMHTRLGSITKTFTVTAILQLADAGKLKLDDPVSKYLDFVPNGSNITLRQLANMGSGLFSYTQDEEWVRNLYLNPYQSYTARSLVEVGLRRAAHFPPGTNINYCNTNTVLLGMVVEVVSGQKVEHFIAERICAPLGMQSTSWPADNRLPTPYAHGYTVQTPDGSLADATFFDPSWGNAAGQMVSNLADLKIWAQALGQGTLLSAQIQQERLTPNPFSPATRGYGLGIGIFSGWVGHTGELPGYNTGVYYLADQKAVLVIQASSDIPFVIPGDPPTELNPVPTLFREIAKIVTPDNVPAGTDFPGEDPGADL